MADLPNPADNTLAVQDDGKDAVFANILETLQSNNSLLGEIDDNTESDETASEKRNRRIGAENTDKKGMFSRAGGALGAGMKGVGGALNKINPFSEGGLGTKMSIALIAGVLFAISKFGDKLVKPLASVLEMIDKEGGVLDKFKETDFFKKTVETFDKIKTRAKLINEDIEKLLKNLTQVNGFISAAVTSVSSFVAKFDTGGEGPRNQYSDGKLDAFELQTMADTIKTNIKDSIVNFTTEVVKGIKGLFLTVGIVGTTLALIKKNAAMATIFGMKGLGPKAAMGIGVGGYLSIAGLLVYGIATTWSNFTDSMKKSLEENENEFIASDFFGKFFGGKDEGGWMNALGKAFDIGATGALIGMAVGGTVGGPVGVIAGGFIGLGIGAVIGGITGWLGSNKMEDFFKKVGTSITDTVDTVVGFFQDVVEGVESAIEGDGFTEGYNKSQGSNYERNKRKHDDAVKTLASYNSGENKIFNLLGPAMQATKIERQEAKIKKFANLMADAPQQKFNNLQADIDAELEEIKGMEAEIKSGNLFRGIDPFTVAGKTFSPSDVSFQSLIEEKIKKIEALRKEQDAHRIKFNLDGGVVPTKLEIESKEKKDEQKRKIDAIMESFTRNFGGSTTSVGSTSFQNTNQNFSTVSANSLKVDDDSPSARLLGPAFVAGGSPLLNF